MKKVTLLVVVLLISVIFSSVSIAGGPPEDQLREALLESKWCLENEDYDCAVEHLTNAQRICKMNSVYVTGVNAGLIKETYLVAVRIGLEFAKDEMKMKANEVIR